MCGVLMNQTTRNFIDQYESKYPDFIGRYCPLADLYDSDLDMFHIEEVQDEYEEFKQGVGK